MNRRTQVPSAPVFVRMQTPAMVRKQLSALSPDARYCVYITAAEGKSYTSSTASWSFLGLGLVWVTRSSSTNELYLGVSAPMRIDSVQRNGCSPHTVVCKYMQSLEGHRMYLDAHPVLMRASLSGTCVMKRIQLWENWSYTYIRTHIHTYIHAYIHTYIHASAADMRTVFPRLRAEGRHHRAGRKRAGRHALRAIFGVR
jgi:hypothetical protein